jgi:hypothetical protein
MTEGSVLRLSSSVPCLVRTRQRGLQVVDVYFPKDRATNRRKNFCFVTFATQQASCNCVCLVCFALRELSARQLRE